MANQMTGRIICIYPIQTIISKKTGQPFYKREIVLDCTRHDQYTGERGFENTPVFEFSGEKCSLLDAFQPGQVVTISFDIQGTKGSQGDRYFNTVRGYKIEERKASNVQQTNTATSQAPQQAPQFQQAPQYNQYPQNYAPATQVAQPQGYGAQYAPPPSAPYGAPPQQMPNQNSDGLPF